MAGLSVGFNPILHKPTRGYEKDEGELAREEIRRALVHYILWLNNRKSGRNKTANHMLHEPVMR